VNGLARKLAERIRAAGPLTVADYMKAALFDPDSGYYATRDPLGVAGDFVTAPEISQIFGELIGLWCVDTWRKMGSPRPVVVAELGPGRGTLMKDALRAARVVPEFGAAAALHLVEASPVLRAAQMKALSAHGPVWHGGAEELPSGPILLIANEFLDALPIRQFVRVEDGWRERQVTLAETGDGFSFALGSMSAAIDVPDEAPLGAVREISEGASRLGAWLGARLTRDGGASLFIDYGYVNGGYGDTLQSLGRHRRHEVLEEPGTADLTAHVDFAAFGRAAAGAGARVSGPVAQARFLSRLGIAERAERLLGAASETQAGSIATGYRRLLDPAAMGSLFKALALSDPVLPALAGFEDAR